MYSNAKEFNSTDNDVYFFNLGKGISKQNLITRTFKIENVSEITVETDKDTPNPYTKKYIEFEFEIESIPQNVMNTLFGYNNARKAAENKPPGELKGYGTPASAGKNCYKNKVYNPGDDSYPTKDIPPEVTVCFNVGCMPGDAPHNSSCVGYLEDPGHTYLGCDGPKYWRCVLSPEGKADNEAAKNFAEYSKVRGGNFLVPALSARYIKSSFQSPHQFNPQGATYGCLNNSSPEDILNTRVMGQCTEIAYNMEGDNKSYYINEFREDINYFEKQVPQTFSVGDTFDYYISVIGDDEQVSGNKNFVKRITFRVNKVGIIIETPVIKPVDFGKLHLNYDYKCTIVSSVGNLTSDKIYYNYLSQNRNSLYNFFRSTGYIKGDISCSYWRCTLPYTVKESSTPHARVFITGYDKDFKFTFVKQTSADSAGGEEVTDITIGNFFLDAYKLPGLSTVVDTADPLDSPIYSGAAIRAGILDTLVLTGTNLESESGKKAYVNVKVSGKPYGIGFFPSSAGTSAFRNEKYFIGNEIINYKAFGKIESFKFQNSPTFPVNTILKSKNGFQIKFLASPPPIYTFENIESPSGDILPFRKDFNYSESEIVNVKNRNLKQYYRNISDVTIPYMTKIDVENSYIPFAIKNNNNTWACPVYKKQIDGSVVYPAKTVAPFYQRDTISITEGSTNETNYLSYDATDEEVHNALNSFQSVGITVYPEDNFVDYDKSAFYGKGDIVKGKVDEQKRLYKSVISKNQGNLLTDITSWEIVDLNQNLSSFDENNFYSIHKEDYNFLGYIRDIKNLDNQNLPALIKRTFENDGAGEFCQSHVHFII